MIKLVAIAALSLMIAVNPLFDDHSVSHADEFTADESLKCDEQSCEDTLKNYCDTSSINHCNNFYMKSDFPSNQNYLNHTKKYIVEPGVIMHGTNPDSILPPPIPFTAIELAAVSKFS